MLVSEKSWLEKAAEWIPGVKGYRDKEARRDTDKRLRETMARAADGVRGALEEPKRTLLEGGQLDLLGVADRIGRKLQKAADSLRYATYGYSGFFDQVKVREEELDQLYQYDQRLMDEVRGLDGTVRAVSGAADVGAALKGLEAAVDALDRAIEGRKDLFNT